jgi:hypothetical protein
MSEEPKPVTARRVKALLKKQKIISLYRKVLGIYHLQDYDDIYQDHNGNWFLISPYTDYEGQPKSEYSIKNIYEFRSEKLQPMTLYEEMEKYCTETRYPESIVKRWLNNYGEILKLIRTTYKDKT